MKIAKALLALSIAAWPAAGQTPAWDSSGNGLLKGNYYLRQVYLGPSSANDGTLVDAAIVYGNVTFDGAGKFTAPSGVTFMEPQSGAGLIQYSGTYSIAASGYGSLTNPVTGDTIYGLVNQQGIFVGSDTETTTGYNDLFVAVPVGTSQATAGTFKGSYSLAYINLSSGSALTTLNATLQMSPDGIKGLGTVALSGYIGGNGSTKTTQSLTGTYTASSGAMVLSFPVNSNTALLAGQYYLYISQDGNFVMGGSPYNSNTPFDMFVGVRTGSGTPALNGLYYQAGIDQDLSGVASGYAPVLDTYFGSLSAKSGSIVGHQRVLNVFANPYDFTYADSYSLKPDGTYSTAIANYVVGASGIRVGSGIGPSLGISVAVPQPSSTGTGVFLDPTGIVNAASSAPFTAGVAPGELLTLYGSNLASALAIAQQIPFPTTVGDVQVTVNGVAAPIYYASPTQVSAIVPYALTGQIAQIQVINNGTASNTVTMFTSSTAPGIFTTPPGGLGYGAVLHSDFSLVTTKSPAQIGETVSVFVTGLGGVNPTISDGAAGVVSQATNAITADIGGVPATVTYYGLAPQLAGLYQVNLTIPSGAAAGDNYLDLAGPDSYNAEAVISIAGAATNNAVTPHRAPQMARPTKSARRVLKP